MNKVNKEYWDNSWQLSDISKTINPNDLSLINYLNRQLHNYFCQRFMGMETKNKKILEIGCAKSEWLPYFSQQFGFDVSGLDYSEIGCEKAKKILSNSHIEGEIICSDFFDPPECLLEKFDVVVSFGVVEHFEDTVKCIQAFSKFLKQGGLIITLIPNMVGSIGLIQKVLNRPVYDIHVLLDEKTLKEAHQKANFEILDSCYFISTSFGVCNLNEISVGSFEYLFKKIILSLLSRFSMVIWWLEQQLDWRLSANIVTSPYIMCSGKKI